MDLTTSSSWWVFFTSVLGGGRRDLDAGSLGWDVFMYFLPFLFCFLVFALAVFALFLMLSCNLLCNISVCPTSPWALPVPLGVAHYLPIIFFALITETSCFSFTLISFIYYFLLPVLSLSLSLILPFPSSLPPPHWCHVRSSYAQKSYATSPASSCRHTCSYYTQKKNACQIHACFTVFAHTCTWTHTETQPPVARGSGCNPILCFIRWSLHLQWRRKRDSLGHFAFRNSFDVGLGVCTCVG